jgi:hypothetical protein
VEAKEQALTRSEIEWQEYRTKTEREMSSLRDQLLHDDEKQSLRKLTKDQQDQMEATRALLGSILRHKFLDFNHFKHSTSLLTLAEMVEDHVV